MLHLPYKELVKNLLRFAAPTERYTIKRLTTRNTLLRNTINHSIYITKTLQLENGKLYFRSDCDQNKIFCLSSAGQLLGSDTAQLKYCNNFLERFTMKKGKNPKDVIVNDIKYHDMFSVQRQTQQLLQMITEICGMQRTSLYTHIGQLLEKHKEKLDLSKECVICTKTQNIRFRLNIPQVEV